MKKRSPTSQLICSNIVPKLCFLIAAVLNVLTTYYVTTHILDSDASSEMVLANHWLETGKILSQDWIYGSELRILHMQLVFAPLLTIFNSWKTVRFLGTLIMQAVYILSFSFLLNNAGVNRRYFFYGATILLLPVSVSYGRIILYHCHYLPNISLSFFLLGLIIGFGKGVNWTRPAPYFRIAILCIFSFLGGLNSIRQLMITHIPILLSIVVLSFVEDIKNNKTSPAFFSKRYILLLIPSILSALASFIGLKVNGIILREYIRNSISYTNNQLGFMDAGYLPNMLYGFFHQFGFRNTVPLVSLIGIFSVAGIVAGIYVIYICIRNIVSYRQENKLPYLVVSTYFAFFTIVMLLAFLLTKQDYYFPLYFSLCLPWAVISCVLQLERIPRDYHLFHAKRIFSWLSLFIIIANGLINIAYFNGNKSINQPYEGLSFQNIEKKEQLQGAMEYLEKNDYDLGYAPYWESNIVTEISNGNISVINLMILGNTSDQGKNNIIYYDCLTSLYIREIPREKQFVLIKIEDKIRFENTDSASYCKSVYQDAHHIIYDIVDVKAFINTLYV